MHKTQLFLIAWRSKILEVDIKMQSESKKKEHDVKYFIKESKE